MRLKVPWTKSMLEKFIEEALLTEDEERVLRTRVAGWSITKQSIELGISSSTVSRMIKNIRQKYMILQASAPEVFPALRPSKLETNAVPIQIAEDIREVSMIEEIEANCGKDLDDMTVEEIIECQKILEE
jgi:hypothetical protein